MRCKVRWIDFGLEDCIMNLKVRSETSYQRMTRRASAKASALNGAIMSVSDDDDPDDTSYEESSSSSYSDEYTEEPSLLFLSRYG